MKFAKENLEKQLKQHEMTKENEKYFRIGMVNDMLKKNNLNLCKYRKEKNQTLRLGIRKKLKKIKCKSKIKKKHQKRKNKGMIRSSI